MKKIAALSLILCIFCLLFVSCSKSPNVDSTYWILSKMEADGETFDYAGQTDDATFAEFLHGKYILKSGKTIIQNSPYVFKGNKMYLCESKKDIKESDIYYKVKIKDNTMIMESSSGVIRTFKKYTLVK